MSEGTTPDIAVVLPVRLPAPWLSECLDSLRAVDDTAFHLVISVHGDSQGLTEQVTGFRHMSIVHSARECTLSDVLNAGVHASSAPFIARIDSDDLLEPDRLREQVDYLSAHPSCVVVASHAIEIDEAGHEIGYRRCPADSEQILRTMRWRNPLIHPSVMFRRTALIRVSGYNNEAYLAEDYELWLRLAQIGDLACIERPLIKYRVHGAQESKRGRISRKSSREVLKARKMLASSRNESRAAAWVRHQVWDSYHLLRGSGS